MSSSKCQLSTKIERSSRRLKKETANTSSNQGKRGILLASKVWWPELSQLSLCSEFDKENSVEFSLISLSTYTLYYCGYVLTLPWSSCYSSHVTHYDCDYLWPFVTPKKIVTLWQSHVILSHTPPCSCKSKEKEKEKKYK